jgi:hypothetical protein
VGDELPGEHGEARALRRVLVPLAQRQVARRLDEGHVCLEQVEPLEVLLTRDAVGEPRAADAHDAGRVFFGDVVGQGFGHETPPS